METPRSCRVAAVQADPVHLDLDATLTKMEGLIAEAAGQGANFIVFPETFMNKEQQIALFFGQHRKNPLLM